MILQWFDTQLTVNSYGTEPAVGKAIKESGVPRDEIFITTKLWNHQHHPDDVEAACDASLKDLGVDYLDLYLMHWPSAFGRGETMFPTDKDGKTITGDTDFVDTYKAMEKLVKSGKCKAIGISNFSKAEVERLLKESSTVPAAHQMELHPYLQQHAFDEFHKSKGIHVTQYSPFGNQNPIYDSGANMGKLIEDPTIVEIGKKHNKSGAQVALAWGIAHEVSAFLSVAAMLSITDSTQRTVIPKSKTAERVRSNLEGDFKLSPEEVKKIDSIDKKLRFNDPSEKFGHKFYTDLDGKK